MKIRKYACMPLLIPIYVLGVAFMLSVYAYAIALGGWNVGNKKFEDLLNLMSESIK